MASLIDPATISLTNEEDDNVCVPAVGASVVIDEQQANAVIGSMPIAANPRVKNFDERSEPSDTNQFSNYLVHAKTSYAPEQRRSNSQIRVDQITDTIYADFVNLMTGGEVLPPNEEYREILDSMVEGEDFMLACDVFDEFLGQLNYVIVHLTSMRLVLTSEQREQVIEACAYRFKDDKHPIGVCLQLIQKSYIGFPPVIRLRNALLECLNRIKANDSEGIEYEVNQVDSQQLSTVEAAIDDATEDDGREKGKKKGIVNVAQMYAIPDNEYDALIQVLSRRLKLDDIENVVLREALKERVKGNLLVAEYRPEPGEFLSSGWRIRVRSSGKLVPRISEIDELWRQCCEVMPECSPKQIAAYLDSRYVGVGLRVRQRITPKESLLKGNRVQFLSRPRCIGSKPMQYVQVDMVEMECSEYGDRRYNFVLIVTDLYSHFVFGRALTGTSDTSLLVRHLMDIFGAFAAPEAYLTYTNHEQIDRVMDDVGKLFRISIKNVGHGVINHVDLCTSIYKRAAEELGGRERWVEALPFAVIKYNQTPLRDFGGLRISPFEIMFGRRPWKNSSIPPWVHDSDQMNEDEDLENYITEHSRDNITPASQICASKSSVLPRRQEVEEKLANVFINDVSGSRAKVSCILGRYPAIFNEEGCVVDPGTGYLFEIGDCVYLRSFDQHETVRNKRRHNESRYHRARIVEVDPYNSDFMYRVSYWHNVTDVDDLSSEQWPNDDCQTAWVSPYDIAAATSDLLRQRNVVRRREMEYQCKCGYDFCELVYNTNCPYKLSQACCQRLRMNCPYHIRMKVCDSQMRAKKMFNTPGKSASNDGRTVSSGAKRSNDGQVSSRWVYQDGRYVELFPVSSPNREIRTESVHYDYEMNVRPTKRQKSGVIIDCQYGVASTSQTLIDPRRNLRRVNSEGVEYETVEIYETKESFADYSDRHHVESLEDLDLITESNSQICQDKNPACITSDPKTLTSNIDPNASGGKIGLRTTKRISAPPRRLSPA